MKIPKKCQTCLRLEDKKCTAYINFQLDCKIYTDDPHVMIKMYEDMLKYVELNGTKGDYRMKQEYKRKIAEYKEMIDCQF